MLGPFGGLGIRATLQDHEENRTGQIEGRFL